MYIQQAELFRGMQKEFLRKIMEITSKESHQEGEVLFREGDPATYSYVLLRGRVELTIGDRGHVVFVVSRQGEAFGWSSLIGRQVYSAGAECREASRLLKMEGKGFQEIVEKDPANGSIFFRRLAATLGNRLLQTYAQLSTFSKGEMSPSFGTGQILGSSGPE